MLRVQMICLLVLALVRSGSALAKGCYETNADLTTIPGTVAPTGTEGVLVVDSGETTGTLYTRLTQCGTNDCLTCACKAELSLTPTLKVTKENAAFAKQTNATAVPGGTDLCDLRSCDPLDLPSSLPPQCPDQAPVCFDKSTSIMCGWGNSGGDDSASGLGTPAIIGIALGAVALIACIAAAVVMSMRGRGAATIQAKPTTSAAVP